MNKKYNDWIKSKYVSEEDKKLIQEFSQADIEKNFGDSLSFGTAGIRTFLGMGTAVLNKYTIKMIAYAWAKYLVKKNKDSNEKKKYIIGHDARNKGKEFAMIVAQVISGMGHKAIMYHQNSIQPTPIVSFTIKDKKYGGGATITASHNPPAYNGFKAFGSYGEHLMPNESNQIAKELKKININTVIPMSTNNITYLEEEYAKYYADSILKCLNLPISEGKMKIVFSPQHGASYKLAPYILRKNGFNVTQVPKQSIPDGNFTHTPDPNPENPKSFNEMIDVGKKIKAELLLTSDPDGDRAAVGVLHNGEYVLLNGHEISALLTHYLICNRELQMNDWVVKTVVTTSLVNVIAQKSKLNVIETLTGFKYLGNEIIKSKKTPIIATEESYGSAICTSISLDKDSLQILPLLAHIADDQFKKNKTLIDYIDEIYKKYGYFIQYNDKLSFKKSEANKLEQLMESYVKSSNKIIYKIEDYRLGVNGLPKTNLIKIYFEKYSWIAIRPSGTEPLIRKYFCIRGNTYQEAKMKQKQIYSWIKVVEKRASE